MGKKTVRIIIILLDLLFFLSICPITKANSIVCEITTGSLLTDYEDAYETELYVSTKDTPYTDAGVLESVAVGSNGWYALAIADGIIHHVNVYNEFCQFEVQYIFCESGSVLVTFDEKDGRLIIFPVRHHTFIKIDSAGEYICAASPIDESEVISELSAIRSFTINQGSKQYIFSGKHLFDVNSQTFSVVDKDGQVLFHYIPSNSQVKSAFFGALFVVVLILGIRYHYKKR